MKATPLRRFQSIDEALPSTTATRIRWLARIVLPHWRLALASGLLMLVGVGLALPAPLLMMHILDDVLPSRDGRQLTLFAVLLFLVLCTRTGMVFTQTVLYGRLRLRVLYSLRRRILLAVERAPITLHHSQHSAYLGSRIQRDCAEVVDSLVTNSLFACLRDVGTLVFSSVVLVAVAPGIGVVVFAILPFHFLTLLSTTRRVRLLAQQSLERQAAANRGVVETLANITVVQAFAAEVKALRRSMSLSKAAQKAELRHSLTASAGGLLASFLSALGPILALLYGGFQIINGRLTVGELVACTSYVGNVFAPTERLVSVAATVQFGLVALERTTELLSFERGTAKACVRPIHLIPAGCRLDMINLGFKYTDRDWILRHLNARMSAPGCIAVIGPSGAGKSTLLRLILRLVEPTEGGLVLDGVKYGALSTTHIRRLISYVPQEPTLFSGTLLDNIRYGARGASIRDVEVAATQANAHDFIMALERGYRTVVGEGGAGLSVGQRQRVCIARAMIRRPAVVLLDEATAAVDQQSEALINSAIKEMSKQALCVVVSHRQSVLGMADQVLEVCNGEGTLSQAVPSEWPARSDGAVS